MTDSSPRLGQLRSSTARLLAGLDAEGWTDADVRLRSLLPGWTRGHVLSHLARNADGIARTIDAALRGELVERYPGGTASRVADIEDGAHRGALELLADVRDSADRLDRVLAAAAAADAWQVPTSEGRAAGAWLARRWREVEIHRVDLGGSYAAGQWPAAFVDYLLPELASTLEARSAGALRIEATVDGSVTTDLGGTTWGPPGGAPVSGPDWALLAWLLGRTRAAGPLADAPELEPWS